MTRAHLLERTGATLREHAVLIGLFALYMATTWTFMAATGNLAQWVIRWFYPWFAVLFIVCSGVRLLKCPASRRWDHVAGAALIGIIAAPFQSTFNSIKQA